MGHAVHYRTAAGESRLEEVPSLAAAVELVERLRNEEEDAQEVRVFREVPLQVRTYYKVVVAEEEEAPVAEPPAAAVRDAVSDEPPPGAMNLSPPPATSSLGAAAVPGLEDDTEQPRRGSLFSRG